VFTLLPETHPKVENRSTKDASTKLQRQLKEE